jgi:hypothetical protein
VLVAGTAGMSLATVIRLEFAYPGVGVLAGDSLQYLSVATAHGVIMVFYMIMPAIFGAFGNFLLPTQLGVHDVAFPRLNSAAFWFLPGGLIMLCQLVCTDRRYARMNCFNIRELQSILKRRFFTDLVNSHDHKSLLDKSMIGVRYRSNLNSQLESDIFSFYNFGLHLSQNHQFGTFTKENSVLAPQSTCFDFFAISYFLKTSPIGGFYNSFFFTLYNFTTELLSLVFFFSPKALLLNPISVYLESFLKSILLSFNVFTNSFVSFFKAYQVYAPNLNSRDEIIFLSKDNSDFFNFTTTVFTEFSSSQRFTRFGNVAINYDYKTGHYVGD